jgi:leucyl-tRNA synthetase
MHLLTQGMVLNEIFFRKTDSGRISYFNPAEIDVKADDKGNRIAVVLRGDGRPVESGGIGTMSKSKNNGVDPQELIEEYGADTARFFMMFAAPPEQTLEWSDSGVEGAARFLRRLWNFAYEHESEIHRGLEQQRTYKIDWAKVAEDRKSRRREIHMALKQANYDMGRHQFNTVASAGMKILNALERAPGMVAAQCKVDVLDSSIAVTQTMADGMSILLRLLSPIAPHICHHLWRELEFGDDILTAPWPEPDALALIADEIELVVQVNGKKRGEVRVPRDADRAAIEKLVLADPGVQKFVAGQTIKKVVVVPGRLVNVVV